MCVESQAITSPANFLARKTPSEDFPEAVGPTIATSGGSAEELLIEKRCARLARGELPAQTTQAADCQKFANARASLDVLRGRHIVIVSESQLDVRPAECWRQRLEGGRGAHRRDRGAVQRLLL